MSKNQVQTTALRPIDTKEMVYMVGDEEVRLTGEAVKKYLVRGNATITDQDLVLFMNLCKYQKLNPFLGEAYLIKFGNDAQIITGKEAFMKRAENHADYEGLQAGIIVQRGDQQLELEGTFHLPTDKLLGGWAKVYRKDKKNPFYQSVALSEYDKKQSLWRDKPSTMIRKVAIVQALREAFPTNLGAMYTEDEMSQSKKPVDVQVEEEIEENANKEYIDIEPDAIEVEAEVIEDEPKQVDNKKSTANKQITMDEGPGY